MGWSAHLVPSKCSISAMLSWNQKHQARECCAVVKSVYWNSVKEKRTEVEDMDEVKTKFVFPSCTPLQIDSFFLNYSSGKKGVLFI